MFNLDIFIRLNKKVVNTVFLLLNLLQDSFKKLRAKFYENLCMGKKWVKCC